MAKGKSEAKPERRDLRAELTERIVEALDRGVVPWSKPWSESASPHNAISERPYHGGNRLLLRLVAQDQGFTDPRWMTFNQARENGWMVEAGQKGTRVEYWKPPSPAQEADRVRDDGEQAQGEAKEQRGWRVFSAVIFNAEQVGAPLLDAAGVPVMEQVVGKDGLTMVDRAVMRPLTEVVPFMHERTFVPIERAQQIVEAIGAKTQHGGDRAYYSPARDEIRLPVENSFRSAEEYYATRLHELGHWSGHESRLNREGITSGAVFGSEVYAKEELRAELASVFMSDEIGLPLTTYHFEQHAAYVASWAKALRENKHEIFAASRDAEKIAEYLIELADNRSLEKTIDASLDRSGQAPELKPGARSVLVDELINAGTMYHKVEHTEGKAFAAKALHDDIRAIELEHGRVNAHLGFENAVRQTESPTPEQLTVLAEASEQLSRMTVPTHLTEQQREGFVEVMSRRGIDVGSVESESLSDAIIMDTYLTSGAAVFDRAGLIARGSDNEELAREFDPAHENELEAPLELEGIGLG